jgi:hypothetical protein
MNEVRDWCALGDNNKSSLRIAQKPEGDRCMLLSQKRMIFEKGFCFGFDENGSVWLI